MFRAAREKAILDLVNRKGIVSFDEIMAAAEISKATAHRYVDYLNEMHQLIKIRGGAQAISENVAPVVDEPSLNAKELMNREEKRRIAKAAVELIEPKDRIILDSGTTVLSLAKLINKNFEGTVITNDIRIAMELSEHRKLDMLLIGGMVRTGFCSSYGYFAEEMLNSISADKLFFSVDAISANLTIMNYSIDDLNVKKICMSRAKERILLCDHSKFSAQALVAFSDLAEVDTIIVGEEIDLEMQQKLQQLNKKLILV